ncbi:MAG: aldo/keto reductase [Acidobacteria bacterium]|nr:aldo/keto reductase [Acidobacteriota bacterium]
MSGSSSRRNFLAGGLALPVAGIGAVTRPETMGLAPAAALADGGLRYKVLGKTGLKVTTVAFGSMITSDQSVVDKAIELGINYIDTARGYQGGNCERMVGAAIKGKRQKLVISTKSGSETKQQALEQLDQSLKELGTDFVDVWFIHGKSKGAQLTDERMEANEIAKKAGKVRFNGVSVHGGHEEIIPAMIQKGHLDVLLSSYNFTMESKIDPLLEQAKKAGLGIVAMKVMAGGARRAKPGDKMSALMKREGAPLAMLKWVLRNKNIDTTIPSITDMDQLDEDMRAMVQSFGAPDEKVLAARLREIRPYYCSMCGACEGSCAQGLPVSDVIRYVSYAEGYGEFQLGRENFLTLAADQQAVRCGDCAGCTVRCPHGVRVAERVARAQELFA